MLMLRKQPKQRHDMVLVGKWSHVLTGPYSKLDYNLNLAASGELVFVSSSCSSQLLNYTIQVRIKKNYTINDEHQHDFFKIQLYIYLNIYNKPNHCLREPDGRHG